ncbi:MAG: hypothetical protein HRU41_13420 [Saprospiraceae bacterium]|nr:hypothetical protein [Saprospiraceae bacterium]
MKRGLTANATRLLIILIGISNHSILANESWDVNPVSFCDLSLIYPTHGFTQTIPSCEANVGLIYFQAGLEGTCEVLPNLSVSVEPATDVAIYPVYDQAGLTTYALLAPVGEYEVLLSAATGEGELIEARFPLVLLEESYPSIQLACNDTIQLPVQEHCQALITADMVLEGEFGCLTNEDFTIEISDPDPSNGPIVDGAGIFNYKIARTDLLPVEGFTKRFHETQWHQAYSSNANLTWTENDLQIDLEPAEEAGYAIAMIQVPHNGTLSADWSYEGTDHLPFFMMYQANPNGMIDVLHTSNNAESGSMSSALVAGSVLVVEIRTGLSTTEPCALKLSNWNFQPATNPSPFFSCGGVIDVIDAQAPVLTCPEISLQQVICTDEDRLLISQLPDGTPNCYFLDASGDVVIPDDDEAASALGELLDWLSGFGYPHASDETWHGSVSEICQPVEICIVDEMESGEECRPGTIRRTFTATDPSGNSNSCEQLIEITSPGIDQIIAPDLVAYIACDMEYPADQDGYPHPDFTGWPQVSTAFGAYDIAPELCNLVAFYEDSPIIDICENAQQFIRTWKVVDWCEGGEPYEFFQTIKIGDVTPPTVYCPNNGATGDTLLFSVGPFDCTGSLWVPYPGIEDNCSESWVLTSQVVTYPEEGEPAVIIAEVPDNGDPRFVSNIPLGVHYFRYIVVDDCGNETIAECPFLMRDNTAPVAACTDVLNVSLDSRGLAAVSATQVDEGSWDECGVESLLVRRQYDQTLSCQDTAAYYGAWADEVQFSCCDIDSLIKVELLVTDLAGNQGSCWMNILIEDKELPSCIPPHDTTILCSELPFLNTDSIDINDFQNRFGRPTAEDNCQATWEELTPVVDLDECGEGVITRIFEVTDGSGNRSGGICEQKINVGLAHQYEILFPKDARAECGLPAPDTIMTFEVGCDLLAVSVEDERFDISPDACFIINRTYRVINWCEYDGESDPIRISRDENCNGEVGEEAVWVINRNGLAFIDRDNDPENAIPAAGEKGESCDGTTNPEGHWRTVESNGYWEYIQVLEIYDNTPPAVFFAPPPPFCSFNNETCKAPIEYFFLVFEACSPLDIEFDIFYDENFDGEIDEDVPTEGIDGEYPKFRILREYPIGSHAFVVIASDGCGNTSRTNLPFDVVDCYVDAPVCINGLAIELAPLEPGEDADGDGNADTGAAVIWATDFLASTFDDCLGPLDYSINVVGEEVIREQTSLVLTCDDMPSVAVEIFSWDQAGNPYQVQLDGTQGGPNFDKCQTYILVQNNLEIACPESANVAGRITTGVGAPLPGPNVMLSGEEVSNQHARAGAGGFYELSNVQTGYDYTITPHWNDNPLNGVTTFDLILITKHILGVSYLNSPLKLLAADVNNSGSITTIDLISLRRVVLGVEDEFPNNTSWRFIDEDFNFPYPENPWRTLIPEAVSLNNLTAIEASNINFIGYKVGDVNNTVSTQLQAVQRIEARDQTKTKLVLKEVPITTNEILSVPLYLRSEEALQGFQFSLQWDTDRLTYLDISGALLEEGHWGTRFVQEGQLTISWNSSMGEKLELKDEDVILLDLRFSVSQEGAWEDLFSLHGFTAAEAYLESDEVLGIGLEIEKDPDLTETRLIGNFPNPFSKETLVEFSLDSSQETTFRVLSATGAEVDQWTIQYAAGWHQFKVDAAHWPSGILYLEMTNNEGRWVQKMVHVRKN